MATETQMEFTKFLAEKYRKFFRFLDVTKTGYLTENNFQQIGENIFKIQKSDDNTVQKSEILGNILRWWTPLEALAEDGTLDESRFIHVIKFIYSDPEEFERLQINCEAGFSRCFKAVKKANGDFISREDLHQCYRWFNVTDKTFTDRVFDATDNDSDGCLSQKEFLEALHKFFFSNDDHVGCKFLFG